MNDEQIMAWQRERDIARATGDQKAIQAVYDHRDEMMMTCIAHQSTRSKRMEERLTDVSSKVETMKKEMGPLKETDSEFRKYKERSIGAVWATRLFVAIAGAVGFETLKAVFAIFEKLTSN